MKPIGANGIMLRFLFALILVLSTYNPTNYSYLAWALRELPAIGPLLILAGIVLVIGWVIFIRATLRSLGPLGLILAGLLFASMIWLLIDWGLLSMTNISALTWVLLFVIAFVLTMGMSWSHIRRRLSGQMDMDDVDED